jgi:maltokinase-like protein
MALLHATAEIRPTKLELLAAWLPSRTWYQGGVADLERVAAFRFDDPAGAVGIETMLVRSGDGPVHQVPVTYRDAPLPDADAWLVGTTEHTLLGHRWAYDACADPVYAAALAHAILTGAGQADLIADVDGHGRLERREPLMTVTASGTAGAGAPPAGPIRRVLAGDPTTVETESLTLTILHRLPGTAGPTGAALTATWPDQPTPVTLAYASVR